MVMVCFDVMMLWQHIWVGFGPSLIGASWFGVANDYAQRDTQTVLIMDFLVGFFFWIFPHFLSQKYLEEGHFQGTLHFPPQKWLAYRQPTHDIRQSIIWHPKAVYSAIMHYYNGASDTWWTKIYYLLLRLFVTFRLHTHKENISFFT